MFIYIAITCLVGLTASSPVPPVAEVPVPSYGFNYAVRDPLTGDNKAQTETRNGGIVKGSYSLTEPDGTLRVVDYVADPIHGFNAVVRRTGPSALHTIGHARPIAGPIVAPMAAAPFAHSRQIGGHSATIWPAAQVSLDLIPDVAGRVGLGGYRYGLGGYGTGLGAYGAGLGGYGAGLGGYGAGLGMIKG